VVNIVIFYLILRKLYVEENKKRTLGPPLSNSGSSSFYNHYSIFWVIVNSYKSGLITTYYRGLVLIINS